MRLRRGRRNTYCNRRPWQRRQQQRRRRRLALAIRVRGSPRKNSIVSFRFYGAVTPKISSSRIGTSEKTRWSEMEGRRRGSVERKALLGRNTCGYANTRSRAIWEEWDMHLGECRYPALRGLQVARKDWSNPRISSSVFHEIGRNRSRIGGGLGEDKKGEGNEGKSSDRGELKNKNARALLLLLLWIYDYACPPNFVRWKFLTASAIIMPHGRVWSYINRDNAPGRQLRRSFLRLIAYSWELT